MSSIVFRSQGLKQSRPMVVCSQDDVFQIVSSLITGCCSSHSGSAFIEWHRGCLMVFGCYNCMPLQISVVCCLIPQISEILCPTSAPRTPKKPEVSFPLTIPTAAVLYCTVRFLIIQYGSSMTSLGWETLLLQNLFTSSRFEG